VSIEERPNLRGVSMPEPLEAKLAMAWPPSDWADLTVLLAVSGGCDSVAMLRALVALRTGGVGRICVGHLNHQLRPEADEDERFVVGLCRSLQVPCEVGRGEVRRLATESGDGIETAARKARYRFLEQTAGRLGARFVVTAHTADDQAETILHRIVRGTGIRGLAGMSRSRPLGHATLIRPLLSVRRAELEAYLDALGQTYRHDSSNTDLRFTRNRVRHQIMPLLKTEFNAKLSDALLQLGELAGETQAVVDGLVADLFARHVVIDGPGTVRIELAGLADRPPHLVRELLVAVWRHQGWPLQAMGRRKWEDISTLATPATTTIRRVFPGEVTVEVAERTMRLDRATTARS
jgi:tRNA(Ile)-lysidine synthase